MSMSGVPDPRPGEFWTTLMGRTVEILAADTLPGDDANGHCCEVGVIAYRFLGGSMIHLRSVISLTAWAKVEFK